MLRRYVAQILSIYNYIDGLMVINKNGIVEYYITYRPEFNGLKEQDIIGKHILEVYPELSLETSSFMRVLRDGKPIFNEIQQLTTCKGHSFYAVNSTMPIVSGEEIIGAVDVSRYLDLDAQKQNITISFKDNTLTKGKDELYCIDDIITNVFNNYSWPGNVRKLKNVIEGAFNLIAGDLIEENELPDYLLSIEKEFENTIEGALGKVPLNIMVDDYERRIIEIALDRTNNMVETANLLNISKQLIKYKIIKYGL